MQKVIRKSRQAGFTLVEIAIVLVIVGLLLAGVLKGQELIENSRIKNIANDMNGIGVAAMTYRDRYQALPGDDPRGSIAYGWTVTSAIAVGNGDGLIGGVVPSFTGASAEQINFFRALRAAGMIAGDPNQTGAAATPQHAGGGRIAVGGIAAGSLGFNGNVVCLNGLSGKYAGSIDRMMDDGVNNSGSIRGAIASAVVSGLPAAAAYDESTSGWLICKQL